jgi:hypothetical protein
MLPAVFVRERPRAEPFSPDGVNFVGAWPLIIRGRPFPHIGSFEAKIMIKQAIVSGIAAMAVFALGGCAITVKSDVNAALFSKVQCRTFSWAGSFRTDSPARGNIANPVNEARLRAAIAAHLETLGMQLATSNADCLVGYGIGARNVIEGAYPVAWGAGFGWHRGGWGWGGAWGGPWGWDAPYVYREGIIGVDLYDAKSREPLWHASANQDLTGVTGEKAEKRINDAVDAIFAKYPGYTTAAPR